MLIMFSKEFTSIIHWVFCLLKTLAVNFLSQHLLLKMLWKLFKNNQWWFPSYHTENLKHGFISLFQAIFLDESAIAVFGGRVQTVCRNSNEEFLLAYLKKTGKNSSQDHVCGIVSVYGPAGST